MGSVMTGIKNQKNLRRIVRLPSFFSNQRVRKLFTGNIFGSKNKRSLVMKFVWTGIWMLLFPAPAISIIG